MSNMMFPQEGWFCNPTFSLTWVEENASLKHQKWLQALLGDDAEVVEKLLNEAGDSERVVLLHNPIWEPPIERLFSIKDLDVRLYKEAFKVPPFAMACIRGSHEVINVLLRQSIDVTLEDDARNNVLHSMVYAAVFIPTLNAKMKEVYEYLKLHLHTDTLRTLLLSENAEGYRPLELASLLEAYPLFLSFMETENIYLVHKERYGVCQVLWYDVTDYELPGENNRCLKSPITHLLYQDGRTLGEEGTNAVFSSGIIKSWSRAKLKCVFPFLVSWFFVRLAFITAFIFHDLTAPWFDDNHTTIMLNGTLVYTDKHHCLVHRFLVPAGVNILNALFLISYSVMTLVIYGIFAVKNISKRIRSTGLAYTLLKRKKRILAWNFYIVALVSLSMGILIQIACQLVLEYGDTKKTEEYREKIVGVGMAVYALSYISLIWVLMFFLQVMPWIGRVTIAIQQMVLELSKFTLVFGLFLMCFSSIFERLLYPGDGENCPEEFSTFPRAVYTTLVATTHAVDFTSFSSNGQTGVFLVHVIFIFLAAILLINFLIALFANTITTVYNNRLVVESVQRLSVVVVLDRVILNCLSRFKMFIMRRHFTVMNGRVYLHRVQIDVKS